MTSLSKIRNILIFCIFMILGQVSVYGLGVVANDLEELEDCGDADQAWRRFTRANDFIALADHNEFLAVYEQQLPNCREFLRSHEKFNKELSYAINNIESLSEYENRIRLSQEEMLEGLYAINGETMDDEIRRRFHNFREKKQESCSPKDRRAELPPIRDQGSVGWCYAFAAADLVSFKSGQHISAADIAVNYNQTENVVSAASAVSSFTSALVSNPLNFGDAVDSAKAELEYFASPNTKEGGFIREGINWGKYNNGYCLEEDIPSDSFESSEIGEIFQELEYFDTKLNSLAMDAETAEEEAVWFCEESGEILSNMFKNVLVSDIADVLQDQSRASLYTHLRDINCRERVAVEGELKETSKYDVGSHKLINELDKILDSDSIAGISYNTQLIGDAEETSGSHASTIVGRRWNEDSDSCQYLIRNSWGSSCYSYGELDCEEGNIWVDSDAIKDHANSIVSYE